MRVYLSIFAFLFALTPGAFARPPGLEMTEAGPGDDGGGGGGGGMTFCNDGDTLVTTTSSCHYCTRTMVMRTPYGDQICNQKSYCRAANGSTYNFSTSNVVTASQILVPYGSPTCP